MFSLHMLSTWTRSFLVFRNFDGFCIVAVQVGHNQHPFLLPLIAFMHDQMHQCLHMLNTWTRSFVAVQVGHNQHPCPGDRQPRSFRHHGLVLQVLSDSLLLITKFLILVPFCPFIITFASQRKRWPCLRKRLGLFGLN